MGYITAILREFGMGSNGMENVLHFLPCAKPMKEELASEVQAFPTSAKLEAMLTRW